MLRSTLALVLAAAVLTSTPTVSAAPLADLSVDRAQVGSLDLVRKADKKSDKKSEKKSSKKIDARVVEIARASRGEDLVYVRIQLDRSGRYTCEMKVKFQDGTVTSPPNAGTNGGDSCVMHFDVPNRDGVVGEALLKVQITDKKGRSAGTASQDFAVMRN